MFKLITDGSEGNVVGVGLLAPAVTPWLSTLAPETGANNPALRLFKYNKETGEVIEFAKSLHRETQESLRLAWGIGVRGGLVPISPIELLPFPTHPGP